MTNHNVPSYSDLFAGAVPEATELVRDIPSISLVYLITKFNFELYFEPGSEKTQSDILTQWVHDTNDGFKNLLRLALGRYQRILPPSETFLLFGRRYLLAYLSLVLKNYNHLPERRFTEKDLINSFLAYLCIIEKEAQEDQRSFNQSAETTEPGKWQEITWPFLMSQFELNYKPNDAIELFKLFAIINHIVHNGKLVQYFDAFLIQNHFPTAGHFIKSIDQVSTILEKNYELSFAERDSMLYAPVKAPRLNNLSLDIEVFKKEINLNINYKLIREKPLLKYDETRYIIFDRAFFSAAISTGFLFEFYNDTPLKMDPAYPTFDRFKSGISKSVLEEKLFRKMIENTFAAKSDVLYFEENENISIPDCFLKLGKDVFFMEFKDNLLKGELYSSYDYAGIKAAIDQKLASPGKGVYQLKKQVMNYINGKFRFAPLPKEPLNIYPVIVHTNFMFSLPGVQQYLRNLLVAEMAADLPPNVILKELVLVNLDTFYWHFENFRADPTSLKALIETYFRNRAVDEKLFEQNKTLKNYVNAYRSFDMEYEQDLIRGKLPHDANFIDIIREISGITQEVLNHKPS